MWLNRLSRPHPATHSVKLCAKGRLVTSVQILGIQIDFHLPNELRSLSARFAMAHNFLAHVLEFAVPGNWTMVTR